jgi:hypothetical protein
MLVRVQLSAYKYRYSLKAKIIIFKIIDVGSSPTICVQPLVLIGKTMVFEAKVIGSNPMGWKKGI